MLGISILLLPIIIKHMESCVFVINRICYCCELFIYLLSLVVILKLNAIFLTAPDKDIINIIFLNHYNSEIDKY